MGVGRQWAASGVGIPGPGDSQRHWKLLRVDKQIDERMSTAAEHNAVQVRKNLRLCLRGRLPDATSGCSWPRERSFCDDKVGTTVELVG